MPLSSVNPPGDSAASSADGTSIARVLTASSVDAEPVRRGSLTLSDRPDPLIVLTWLQRLRWFALAGQSVAILTAWLALRLDVPVAGLVMIMALTAVTNLGIFVYVHHAEAVPRGLAAGLILLDVIVLTLMLALTGGPENPFCVLYVIHVAMAVVVLPAAWTWTIFGVSLASFAMLFGWHVPLTDHDTPAWVFAAGNWMALAIAAGLIAYFLGRLRLALRQREEQVAQMESRIQQSERLASLTTLAAGAAHELGTPLGTIALITHELVRQAEKLQLPAQTIDDVRLIREEVNRCRRILDRMNIDNLQGSDEPAAAVAIDDLIDELYRELKPGQDERFDVVAEPSLQQLSIRRNTLVQTLSILIQNGFDASEETGSGVTLRIAADMALRVPVEAGESRTIGGAGVQPSGEAAQPSYAFTVEDQGCGMTAEQLRRLGEPFVSSKGQHRGMGLGLFLARLMAEHLRGSLTIESAVGRGTRCVLQFPVEAESR